MNRPRVIDVDFSFRHKCYVDPAAAPRATRVPRALVPKDYTAEIQRRDGVFEVALGLVRADPVAEAGIHDLRALRRAIWEPILERMAVGLQPPAAFIEAIVRPAWVYDEELTNVINRWDAKKAAPVAHLAALERAVNLYARLVQNSWLAQMHQRRERAIQIIREMRPERDPLQARTRRASATVIAERLAGEVVHPQGLPWTKDTVLQFADSEELGDLFPGSRRRVMLLPDPVSLDQHTVTDLDGHPIEIEARPRPTTEGDDALAVRLIEQNQSPPLSMNAVVELVIRERPMGRKGALALLHRVASNSNGRVTEVPGPRRSTLLVIPGTSTGSRVCLEGER